MWPVGYRPREKSRSEAHRPLLQRRTARTPTSIAKARQLRVSWKCDGATCRRVAGERVILHGTRPRIEYHAADQVSRNAMFEHFDQALLIDHFYAQFVRLVQLRSWLLARDDETGFLTHRRAHLSTGRFNALPCLFATDPG